MKIKVLHQNILLLMISVIAFISCGKSSGYGNNNTTTPPPVANTVSIVNMSFTPATLTVSVGTTVTWTNNDGMTHTVTSDASGFDSGDITMGSKYSKVFSVAGTYAYHCTIHPAMKGTIVVK
ncbi:MAG TPA: cupredoxin family copper-binding protein [Puia sp.]|nr:cupredoxin family copper-binding protein [Puia sp.]